jgi:nucleotide-binding universal stress UspA family protein
MFKRILIATDGEDGLDRLGKCLGFLRDGGIEHVGFVRAVAWKDDALGIPDETVPEIVAAEAALRNCCGSIPTGLVLEMCVQIGKPAEVIQRAIQQFHSDLVIMGTAVRDLLTEKVFGSNTMQLLPKLQIPLLVVRPQLIGAFTLEELQLRCRSLFRYLLVPYGFDESAQQFLGALTKLLLASPDHQCQSLQLLYVVDPSARSSQMSHPQVLQQTYQQDLEGVRQTLIQAAPEVKITTQVRIGTPVQEILRAAAEADVTAIATSSQRAGRFWEWSVPSLTGEILRRSWHPVLFVPY